MKDPPKRKERQREAERKKRGPWRSLHLYKQGAPKKQIFCCDARIHDAVTGPTNHGRTGGICGNLSNYQLQSRQTRVMRLRGAKPNSKMFLLRLQPKSVVWELISFRVNFNIRISKNHRYILQHKVHWQT